MFPLQPTKQNFGRLAFALIGFSAFILYGLISTDSLSPSSEPLAAANEYPGNINTEVSGSRFGGRIAIALNKPLAVQYVTPPFKIQAMFEKIGYRLENVRQDGEVPRFFIAELPTNYRDITQSKTRKAVFIKLVLPLILNANEDILQEREKLLALRDKIESNINLTTDEANWLRKISKDYNLDRLDISELVRRIDTIPPSLALAQAAEESGWGTSRFAREGNAIFGQRIWHGDDGIEPERREDGARFRVRSFARLIDGVKSYTRNLNSHFAYNEFRRLRFRQRVKNNKINGYELAATLLQYSQRGQAYTETIRMLMRVNNLQIFDKARLQDPPMVDNYRPDA